MGRKRSDQLSGSRAPDDAVTNEAPGASVSFPIVGVGASAGGLEAFRELLAHLPLDTGMAFVLVQHLDPVHESALTQLLTRVTSLPVREVTHNLRVEPNSVYIIPPNTNLGIKEGVLRLRPRPRGRTPNRSIDFFLESLAQDQGERAIGVILSGTATDGTLGLEAIKAEGGITFAQDETAKYDSMPRSAVMAGCVDFVLSPQQIAEELARIAKHPYVAAQPDVGGEPIVHDASPEADRSSATAHGDDTSPLPSGGHGTPPTESTQVHAEAERSRGEKESARIAESGFKKIILLLRNHTGVDFSLYKSKTIQRRIMRRVVLSKQNTLENYIDFLRGNSKELDALYSDALISVTSFFRDPEAFAVLKRKVFPKLFQQRSGDPLRVWVLGCSTGQEAYSIAMTFVECAEKARRSRKLQVFATDLNDALLDKARVGLYAKTLAQDVSPQRLRRFFVEEEGGYRVVKSLREMVVFARQSLITDPPFSRIDLISCRNLLIYLEPTVQKKAFPTFHYALKSKGFLFLGASESIGGFTDLFEPADAKHRIFSKKAAPTPAFYLPVKTARDEPTSPRQPTAHPAPATKQDDVLEGGHAELNAQREADRVMVHQFAPPGVLISDDLQILQFRGPTGAYLEPPTGKATFDLLKMAREGLMLPLRAAINKAKKEKRTARKENVPVQQNGRTRLVNVEVIPLKNVRERCFLVLFEDAEKARRGGSAGSASATERRGGPKAARLTAREESRRIFELETELSETRDYLQSIQEQHDAANEELQASSEEVQSANEELQSSNEELETSKEELESANEELTTINEEMSNRNAELNRLNSDLANLQVSTRLPILLLGRDLTIRRVSDQAEKQFGLTAAHIGRPFGSIRHNLVFEWSSLEATSASTAPTPHKEKAQRRQGKPAETSAADTREPPNDLESFISDVIATVREAEREVRDKEGHWHSLRVRPYLTLDNKVDGAVLVLVDISHLKRTEQAIADARDYAEAIVHTARDPLLILDADLRVHTANDAFYSTFHAAPAEVEGRLIYDLGNRQWNMPGMRQLLESILPAQSVFNNFEVTHDFEHIGRRTMLLNARALRNTTGRPERILLGIQDVTERMQVQAALGASQTRYRALVEASAQIVWTTDPTGAVVEDSPSWRAFTGQTFEQWKGFGGLDALHPDDRERVSEQWRRTVAARAPLEIEYRVRHVSGAWRWTVARVVPVLNADGSVCEYVGMNIDITERKDAEDVRRDTADALRQLSVELAEADRRKNHFLAMLAHELRGPLAPLRNAVQLIRLGDVSADTIRPLAEMMDRQVGHLVRLVDDLLDVSRIARGKIALQKAPLALASVVNDAVEAARPYSEGKHQRLTVTLPAEPLYVYGDATRLNQAVGNLLNNACKFTERAGSIWLTVERVGEQAVIRVRDNGIGIAEEELHRIFDVFAQIDVSLERGESGLGIGLTIVKNLVEMHGGTVEARSAGAGQGSEFVIRLPILDDTQITKPETPINEATPLQSDAPSARETSGTWTKL